MNGNMINRPEGAETGRPITPAEGSLRPATRPDGVETIEIYRDGKWHLHQPARGHCLPVSMPNGYRYDVWDGRRWVSIGEIELLPNGSSFFKPQRFPTTEQILVAARKWRDGFHVTDSPSMEVHEFSTHSLATFLDMVWDEAINPPASEGA